MRYYSVTYRLPQLLLTGAMKIAEKIMRANAKLLEIISYMFILCLSLSSLSSNNQWLKLS